MLDNKKRKIRKVGKIVLVDAYNSIYNVILIFLVKTFLTGGALIKIYQNYWVLEGRQHVGMDTVQWTLLKFHVYSIYQSMYKQIPA